MNTFTKELSYISQQLKPSESGAEWVGEIVKKTATFKELCQTDPDQRDLCWLIMEIFEKKGKNKEITINRDVAAELTDLFIETMLELNDDFKEADKKEFLKDNGAVVKFGLWLSHEKVLPFFLQLIKR